MGKNYYLTTTLPYVNANPHIGTAYEFVIADIIARHRRLLGDEVFFNTGVDEHGQKVYTKALEEGKDPQDYADEYADKFRSLKEVLNLSYDNFIRTTDARHKYSAREFWKKSLEKGDIYKKSYKTKYCVGCELEKTDSELINGCCVEHPNQKIQIIEEENYFFKFSKYQKPLLELYEKNPQLVIPDFRFNEIKRFIERGLEDFSVSRLKSKMPWGVPVPGDDEHVMFVWFDALVNYISAIGWPDDIENFNKWWPVTQFAGKDQVRQQAAMFQAMLMSVGLSPSKRIVIHGFITINGVKMSKSVGNVIDPNDIVKEYGTDALRYYLARHINPFEDSDFTMEKFKDAYNANLANGIGNLTARIIKLAETYLDAPVNVQNNTIPQEFKDALNNFEVNKATDLVWEHISDLDKYIQDTKPFSIVKCDKEKAVEIIKNITIKLYTIGRMLSPILPQTSEKIKNAIKENKMPESLFMRKYLKGERNMKTKKLNILAMNRDQLIAVDPDDVDWQSGGEIFYMLKKFDGYLGFDYSGALKSGNPGHHFELKSGLHSDVFLDFNTVLQYKNLRKIIAMQLVREYKKSLYESHNFSWSDPACVVGVPTCVAGIPNGATLLGEDVADIFGARKISIIKKNGKIIMASALELFNTLLFVEDVFTKGTALNESINAVMSDRNGNLGRILPFILTIVNRGRLSNIKTNIGFINVISLCSIKANEWDKDDCELCKMGSKTIKPKIDKFKK